VVEATFIFGRHTGVTLEPRAVVADWNAGEARLTVYQGTQAPHMMQNLAPSISASKSAGARGLQGRRRLVRHQGAHLCRRDGDLRAVETAARPVKFVADRVESFNTDIHARDHRCKGKIGVKRDGTITAFEIDDLTGIGPYSMYPRTSAIEANQVVNLVGGPYT
jgi:carbon-monoxide dehydrogenase large subunit